MTILFLPVFPFISLEANKQLSTNRLKNLKKAPKFLLQQATFFSFIFTFIIAAISSIPTAIADDSVFGTYFMRCLSILMFFSSLIFAF